MPTPQITDPFEPPKNTGSTTQDISGVKNPFAVKPATPAPTQVAPVVVPPKPTPLESYASGLDSQIKTQFPNSTPNDRAKVLSSFMFPANPHPSKAKSFTQLVQDAQQHRDNVAMENLPATTIGPTKKPSPVDKFAGDKISQGPVPKPAPPLLTQGIPDNGALLGLQNQEEAGTQQVYPFGAKKGVTVPGSLDYSLFKAGVEFPEELSNTISDIHSILTTGKPVSNALQPYDPVSGTGRKIPDFVNAFMNAYQAGTKAGLDDGTAKWAAALSGFGTGVNEVTAPAAVFDGLSKLTIAKWNELAPVFDATKTLGYPEMTVLADGTMEDPLQATKRAFTTAAKSLMDDKGNITDPASFQKLVDAYHTLYQAGGPATPSAMFQQLADAAYMLQSNVLTGVSGIPESGAAYAGKDLGQLPGYRKTGAPVSVGLSMSAYEPVGFGEDGVPKGFEISEDGAVVPSDEYKTWLKQARKESKISLANEKDPNIEPFNAEAEDIYNNANTHDPEVWRKFSEARGYTPKQIAQYEKYQKLFKQGQDDFGMTEQEVGQAIRGNSSGAKTKGGADAKITDHDYNELIKTKEYHDWESEYLDVLAKNSAAEKDMNKMPWSEESKALYEAKPYDWKAFSKSRGYTDSEIAGVQREMELTDYAKKTFAFSPDDIQELTLRGSQSRYKGIPVPVPPISNNDASLLGGKKFIDESTESGIKQIEALLAQQPLSPIAFGIGQDPDGLTVSDLTPNQIARAGTRARIMAPSTINMKSVLVNMVADIMKKSADLTTPFEMSVLGAYQDLLSNPNKTKQLELLVKSNDPRLNYIPHGSGGKTTREILEAAIEALKNDPGGEALIHRPSEAPVGVQTVPKNVAKEIYDKWIKNTQITGSDILSEQDIESFKNSETSQEIAAETQRTSLGAEELFGNSGESGGTGTELTTKKGPGIELSPEQQAELKKLVASGQFSAADIEEFKNTMMGKPMIRTQRPIEGASEGMRAVGEGGQAELRKIASGESAVPVSGPKNPDEVAKTIVAQKFVEAIASKFGLDDEQIKTIAEELEADTTKTTAGAKKFGSFLKSYIPGEGDLQAKLMPLIDALKAGDLAAVQKFSAQPGIDPQKFNEMIQAFDSTPTRTAGDLAKAIVDTFGAPAKGNNIVGAANAYLASIGYPGNVESMLKDINESLSQAVQEKKIPHTNDSNANRRPSKYYLGKQMMDAYFNYTGIEGKAMGFIKNTLHDYLNRLTYFPENESRDIFDVGDSEEGLKTEGEIAQESKPAPAGEAKGKTAGAGGLSTKTQYGQGRVYEHPIDAIQDGARQRTWNAEMRMKDYGYKYARAYSSNALMNTMKSGKIGNYYVGRPPAEDWINAGEKHPSPFTQQRFVATDAEGNSKILTRNLWMHPSFFRKVAPILEVAKAKSGALSELHSGMRAIQSEMKYIQMSLSMFHAKQLGLTAAAAAGPQTLGKWMNMKIDSPEFRQLELEMIGASGMTSSIGKSFDNFTHLTFGEDASGEVIRKSALAKIPGMGTVVNNGVSKWVAGLADKNQAMIFDKLQRFIKVTDYAGKMADWMAKNPKATLGQIQAARVEMASLGNGFFGGLNWPAMGVGKGALEIMKTMMFAPDWTVSNLVPLIRAFAGRPKALTEISQPDFTSGGTKDDGSGQNWTRNEPGYEPDARSVAFLAKTAMIGIFLTQGMNYLLNGKMNSKDYFNVTIGIDGKGREIKGNFFFPGFSRDVVNFINYYNENGIGGAMFQFASSKAAPLVGGAISTAEMLNSGGVDSIGNNIYDPENSPLEKSWKSAEYFAQQSLPLPISMTNPIEQYDKYANNGGTTVAENTLALTNFGYISHKHTGQAEENNFWATKTELQTKVLDKKPLTAQEIAIANLIKKSYPQIKALNTQRDQVGQDGSLSYSAKYNKIIALDNQIQELMSRALNPTDQDLKQAAIEFQIKNQQAAYHAQFVGQGANTATAP